MNRMRYLVLFLVFLSACSHGWTRNDTYRQTAVIGLQVIDWRQSHRIATERVQAQTICYPNGSSVTYNEGYRWQEFNPILGEHPVAGRVDAYFAASIAGHALISYLLPPKYRSVWQILGMGYEGAFIVNNFSAGIRW